jgi:hypothetical protein
MPSNLVLAYRATDYVAFNDSRAFLIRIGRHSLVIDGLLAKMKTRSGAFITAWNPFSKSLSAGANTNGHWDRPTCAQARVPIDEIVSGSAMSLFQASQAASTMSS